MKFKIFLFCWLLIQSFVNVSFLSAQSNQKPSSETLIDAVVASVNGQPITLSDINRRLPSARHLSLRDLSGNPEGRMILDAVVLERVILAEAAARRMSVSQDEIERYLNEIAARNNLSRDGFESALVKESRDINEYKEQIKIDILRSRIASSYMQSIGVSETEIDAYIKEHPELSRTGARLKLSRVFVGLEKHTEAEAQDRVEQALARLKSGESFTSVAKDISESPEGKEGGSLGEFMESDLSHEIFDAVLSLAESEYSGIVRSTNGFQIFKVDSRSSDVAEGSGPSRDEVRKILQQEKVKSKMEQYFTSELFKAHSVDKKI